MFVHIKGSYTIIKDEIAEFTGFIVADLPFSPAQADHHSALEQPLKINNQVVCCIPEFPYEAKDWD